MTIVLGIEMSNPTASPDASAVAVARCDEHGGVLETLAHAPMPKGARGSDGVMALVQTLCAQAGVKPAEIARIAVGVGPGGYTALRIAATTAKVLADTIGCAVVPVPAVRVAAGRIAPEKRPAAVALASKGERAWCAIVGEDGTIEELGVVEAAGMLERGPRALFGDAHLPGSFRAGCAGARIEVCPVVLDARDCIAAAARCPAVDPMDLGPIYAREPDAVTQWRARHG